MSMEKDHYYAEMLNLMREQGKKDNPITLQLGVMLSANSVKIDDLTLNAEDLYIADHLVADYTRTIKVPYVSKVEVDVQVDVTHEEETPEATAETTVTTEEQEKIIFTDGLKSGDLVAVQKLSNNNKYVILARVVQA